MSATTPVTTGPIVGAVLVLLGAIGLWVRDRKRPHDHVGPNSDDEEAERN